MEAKSRIFYETKDESLLRQFSAIANDQVVNVIGSKMPPGLSVIFIMNSLTGLSLLTLPYGFNQTGLLLGAAILFGCMVLAFTTSTFMCEALTIANALQYEEAEKKTIAEYGPAMYESLHQQRAEAKEAGRASAWQQSTMADFLLEARNKNYNSEFKIRERVELGAMGEMVLRSRRGKGVAIGIYIMILSFTYGTAAALVVTVNMSLAHTVCSARSLLGFDGPCNEASMYSGCVVVTFLVTLPLCFANIQKTKRFTMVIMILRFISIALLLAVASFFTLRRFQAEGTAQVLHAVPLWRSENFMAVFGNAVFLFGIHHYIPSMIAPLEPQHLAPRVIWTAFCICYVLIVAVCATAMVAWGGQTDEVCSSMPGGHFCVVQPIYNLNFQPLGWLDGVVGLFILTYPAMSIASIPIAAITTRNTMGKWLGIPAPDPEVPYTAVNIVMTLSVLVPPFGVALVTTNVQAVIQYVGGYAGLTVAILCPLILVIKSRRALQLERGNDIPRPLKSPFANRVGFAVVLVFYCFAFVLVTRKLFFTVPPA